MPIAPIADITDALRAIRTFHDSPSAARLNEGARAKLDQLAFTPVAPEAISHTAELLYAQRADLDDEARTVAIRLVVFAASWMWYGLGQGSRGINIADALNRDAGGKLMDRPVSDPAFDPAPLNQFLEQPMPSVPAPPIPAS